MDGSNSLKTQLPGIQLILRCTKSQGVATFLGNMQESFE